MTLASGIRSGLRSATRTGVNPSAVIPSWRLTKTNGTAGFDAGASTQTFAGDGYIQFKGATATHRYLMGLSATDPDQSYTFQYAIDLQANGNYRVLEGGSQVFAPVAGSPSDVYRVKRVGTTITYIRNGSTFYTSATSSSVPLLGDCCLQVNGSIIANVRLFGASDVEQSITWNNIVGCTAVAE